MNEDKDIKSLYIKEFDFYDDIFKINYNDNSMPYSNVVPDGKIVKEIMKQLPKIWDNIQSYTQKLKTECDSNLTSLIIGANAPHKVLPAISRTALFTKKIFIAHPMLFYLTLEGSDGPQCQPEAWAETFMKAALYMCSLRDWVAEDYLRFIPLPSQYSENVKNRIKYSLINDKIDEKKMRDLFMDNKLDSTVEIITEMDDSLRKFFLEKLRKEDKNFYNQIIEALKDEPEYPKWMNIPINKESHGSIFHTGVNLHPVEVKYLAKNWNVYITPLTNFAKIRFDENIKTKYNAVNNFLYDIPIKFPNNVPINYIYKMKTEGLLSEFSDYLVEQYDEIRNLSSEDDFNAIQEKFNVTIKEQLEKMEYEINSKYKSLLKDILEVGINSIGGIGYGFSQGEISISSLINIVGGGLFKGVQGYRNIRKAKKNPLIVLHKISNNK